ncbi:IS110 family transposase [Catellatospora tritici]|uniref:IS110 family transposase n=1 Tax=Catellatospora tritici TaxID=2851566 RepID=UPI001C2D4C32|nr:transposase [Catellatospora tritici]MBV1856688.1 IS110 family transposase [Catellatospora tritici]
MVVIGVDPHKRQHTAAAIQRTTQQQLGSVTIEANLDEYRRLLAWARQWPQRTWAVENARGLGRHLAQWLLAWGETVVDVPATATRRVRELSRGGRRKNDVIDAAANTRPPPDRRLPSAAPGGGVACSRLGTAQPKRIGGRVGLGRFHPPAQFT